MDQRTESRILYFLAFLRKGGGQKYQVKDKGHVHKVHLNQIKRICCIIIQTKITYKEPPNNCSRQHFQMSCADPEGGPNHKFIGFPCNTGPDPLEITKLPSQHSTVGHYRPASETPFQWRFTGRLIIARFLWSLEPRSP